jgi:hypothetical protein
MADLRYSAAALRLRESGEPLNKPCSAEAKGRATNIVGVYHYHPCKRRAVVDTPSGAFCALHAKARGIPVPSESSGKKMWLVLYTKGEQRGTLYKRSPSEAGVRRAWKNVHAGLGYTLDALFAFPDTDEYRRAPFQMERDFAKAYPDEYPKWREWLQPWAR